MQCWFSRSTIQVFIASYLSYQLLVKYSITFYIFNSFSIAYVLVITQHVVKGVPGTWYPRPRRSVNIYIYIYLKINWSDKSKIKMRLLDVNTIITTIEYTKILITKTLIKSAYKINVHIFWVPWKTK